MPTDKVEKKVRGPGKNKGGRPRRIFPTDVERQIVRTMSGHGVPHLQIASLVCGGIDRESLAKHFSKELIEGAAVANSTVGATLYQRATSGKDTTAGIFWAKCRMGWVDTQRHEVGGIGGEPVKFSQIELVIIDPKGKGKRK